MTVACAASVVSSLAIVACSSDPSSAGSDADASVATADGGGAAMSVPTNADASIAPSDGGVATDGSMSGDGSTSEPDGAISDAGDAGAGDGGDGGDGGSEALTACPTKGSGAISDPNTLCSLVTPAQAGASATGENATVASYALTPLTAAGEKGELLLFLNGSGSAPSRVIADPMKSFYTAATSSGYDVLALSYSSDASLKTLCSGVDSCFFPSRKTLITGVYQTGADSSLTSITLDQGILERARLTLRWLAANDEAHGWSQYLQEEIGGDPATAIVWSKVAVAGHSQGGGHAAAMGNLYPIVRAVQLSATCDEISDGGAASWLQGSSGTWQSDPTQFYGLDVVSTFTNGKPTGGDTTCPSHALSWASLGMLAAHRDDDGATCDAGAGTDLHGYSVSCVENYPTWKTMLH